MVKLVVDDKIPYISDFFTLCDKIIALPGELITQNDLLDADILLTRTVTTVDEKLLSGTSVRFVGTATTGTDHIDTAWLAANHIVLATAAGANAQAVAEYVAGCLAALDKKSLLQDKKVVGIIGCGRIGRLVAVHCQSRGFDVMYHDPLLTEKCNFNCVSLEKLIRASDIISIHTPLTKTGLFPTFHMLDESVIQQIKSNAILINTARGEVIDQTALLSAKNIMLCLDVWENEPNISLELLDKVFIGTPHIAGYSLQAKYRATQMMYENAATFFGWPAIKDMKNSVSTHTQTIYDPLAHTQQFREAFSQCKPEDIKKIFVTERTEYPLR